MKFNLSRLAMDKYRFDDSLFSDKSSFIFENFHTARLFAQKLNQNRDLLHFPELAVSAAQIYTIGLINEIFHLVIMLYDQYCKHNVPMEERVMEKALKWIEDHVGKETVDKTLIYFTNEFPVFEVYKGAVTPQKYLLEKTGDIPNAEIVLERILLLWLTNKNPACDPYKELFDDERFSRESAYNRVIEALQTYFQMMPLFGPENQNLVTMLRSPAIAVPYSLSGQLEYIRDHWASLIGSYLFRLLSGLDFIKEEEKIRLAGAGPAPVPPYEHLKIGLEPEKFSQDHAWMSDLVLIAKNVYVWMDQLSKKYQMPITRLDQIPMEELKFLADSGITGLWLIGVWERSKASAKIKQICGNPEALASAYSLLRYEIAHDLGGEEALEIFKQRAWAYGIRLGSDMVPNHMGIDSDWVLHQPEWFIYSEYCPFPAYSFTGIDLSPDERVEIHIEDHYYERTDAAVVFRRKDRATGRVIYIYHGNDGTSMPWNDTAQLNYLNPEVREVVIQTILSVARKFPIIRFDAAMTLTKQHYHRLWFPEPGRGGDIPSRSEFGLTKDQFDSLMPNEFWREVVDHVAQELPGVLLLAEAFWLLEGYFVRTLGMHRVYNSAFMNMMRDEDNAKYRSVMKNTLAFEPEILRRFVNFMNNPDERTAVDQFGKGDKYFGICVLLATLPGLPMFGHGQIEGYTEKYGMEYRKAYLDEKPDMDFVERHQREIFPLLRKRYLYAGVANFLLYDFIIPDGAVNENVIAFSNSCGEEAVLVVFHNRYASTEGWIHKSVPYLIKTEKGERSLIQKTIFEGLSIKGNHTFILYKDQIRKLEYIIPAQLLQQQGLFIHLDAYSYYVFSDFRAVSDDEQGSYRRIWEYLNYQGVPSIDDAIRQLYLQPVHHPFRQIINPGYLSYLLDIFNHRSESHRQKNVLNEMKEKYEAFLQGISQYTHRHSTNQDEIARFVTHAFQYLAGWKMITNIPMTRWNWENRAQFMLGMDDISDIDWLTLLIGIFLSKIGKIYQSADGKEQADYRLLGLSWIEEWQLPVIIVETLRQMGFSEDQIWGVIQGVKILILCQDWYIDHQISPIIEIIEGWLSDPAIQSYLGVNRFDDRIWFNETNARKYLKLLRFLSALDVLINKKYNRSQGMELILSVDEVINLIEGCLHKSEFQIDKWLRCIDYSENKNIIGK